MGKCIFGHFFSFSWVLFVGFFAVLGSWTKREEDPLITRPFSRFSCPFFLSRFSFILNPEVQKMFEVFGFEDDVSSLEKACWSTL